MNAVIPRVCSGGSHPNVEADCVKNCIIGLKSSSSSQTALRCFSAYGTKRNEGKVKENDHANGKLKIRSLHVQDRKRITSSRNNSAEELVSSPYNRQVPSFLERLVKAWRIMFPAQEIKTTEADAARERLRLVLYSDREDFGPDLKNELCENIVRVMSDVVDVKADNEVGFSVERQPESGSVYKIQVLVSRVKPTYQVY